jgi:Cu/Ag efflux protein CusF
LLLLVLAVACDRPQRYGATGEVVEVDQARHEVVIRHPAIADLLQPGTSRFGATGETLTRLSSREAIRFDLERRAGRLVVVAVDPISQGRPGLHDHTPHHGGVVAMVGMLHLEALAIPDGRVRLYLTDVWRRPLPLETTTGSVTLRLAGGKQALPLTVVGGFLQAHGPPLRQRELNARFDLVRDGQAIDMTFQLPVGVEAAGAAGIPETGCVPLSESSEIRMPRPRCVLTFARPISVIETTPDGSLALVAVVDLGVTGWRLPAVDFGVGFAPPPPIEIPVSEGMHAEAANAVATRPSGEEVVVAMENRLLVYSTASGQLVRELARLHGVVRSVAWSPDGATLLVSLFYDRFARGVRSEDGKEQWRLEVEREGAAVAFDPSGRLAAVGSEPGPITVFDVARGRPLHVLKGFRGPARSIAFAGSRILAAGDDGTLRAWEATSDVALYEVALGGPSPRLAVSADHHVLASAGVAGAVHVHDVASGNRVRTLQWHDQQVLGLAWAGSVLISGDAAGRVAVWDLEG